MHVTRLAQRSVSVNSNVLSKVQHSAPLCLPALAHLTTTATFNRNALISRANRQNHHRA
jgi:hypothetical protein